MNVARSWNLESNLALSIIVPCYNESQNIPLILDKFEEVMPDNSELILVNNGSTDDSATILERELVKPQYAFARTVKVEKNIGYGYGIYFGLTQAKGQVVAYTHADLQTDPADVIKAFHIFRTQNVTLVKGNRRQRKIIPKILSGCFEALASVIFLEKYYEVNAQPKVFSQKFFQTLERAPWDFNLDFYINYKAKRQGTITDIPVEFPERQYGESKWAFSHLNKLKTIHRFFKYLLWLRFFGEEKAKELSVLPKELSMPPRN
jgi:polyisoprenyl-phosphate glycosyltransferase